MVESWWWKNWTPTEQVKPWISRTNSAWSKWMHHEGVPNDWSTQLSSMNVQQSDYAVMSISVRSQNWVGEMWVTCLVGQNIECFTCFQVWGGLHFKPDIPIFTDSSWFLHDGLFESKAMVVWRASDFFGFHKRTIKTRRTVIVYYTVCIYIYINIQLLYKFGIVQTSHFQVSRCCAGSTEAMLVWKQLLGKITQYKKDYLNRSSPHPSFHPNRNQTTRKCPQYCSTKTKGSNWPFTPGVCSWFSGSSRLIGSCCLSSFQRAGD